MGYRNVVLRSVDRQFIRQVASFVKSNDEKAAVEFGTSFEVDGRSNPRAYFDIESVSTGNRHIMPILGKKDGSVVIRLTNGDEAGFSKRAMKRFVDLADQRASERAQRKGPSKGLRSTLRCTS